MPHNAQNINKTKLSAYQRFDDIWSIQTNLSSLDNAPVDGLQITDLIDLENNVNIEDVEFNTQSDLAFELRLSCSGDVLPGGALVLGVLAEVPIRDPQQKHGRRVLHGYAPLPIPL